MGRTIAIVDIHGCADAFRALIAAIAPAAEDTLVPLGDYIDRGSGSRGVIEALLDLESRCQLRPLLGNYEIMLLDALNQPRSMGPWLDCGGRATLASYGHGLANIPAEHLDFVRRCRPYFETPTHLFFHANYQSDIPPAGLPVNQLYWEHLHQRLPRPHESGKIAVVGHSSHRSGQILDAGHVVCIDTYCHGGGWLTALVWIRAPFGRPIGKVCCEFSQSAFSPFPPRFSDV